MSTAAVYFNTCAFILFPDVIKASGVIIIVIPEAAMTFMRHLSLRSNISTDVCDFQQLKLSDFSKLQ